MRARMTRSLPIAALVAVALAVAVLMLSGGDRYELTAVFDQTHGLVEGGEVQAAGLKVGKVKQITLGADRLPRVRMSVDDDYRVRRGATAEVRFFSVAGEVNRYVMLRRGSGPELPDGATLGPGRTDQPVEIDQVISTLDAGTRRDVRDLLGALDDGFRGRGGDIERTLEHSADALGQTAELLAEVRGDGHSIRTLLSRSRSVVGRALARSRRDRSGDRRAGRAAQHLGTARDRAVSGRPESRRRPALPAPGARAHRLIARHAARPRRRRPAGRRTARPAHARSRPRSDRRQADPA